MTRRGWGAIAWVNHFYEYLVYYGFLLIFGSMCLFWSLVSVPLAPLLPRQMGRRLGRWMISFGFRAYLAALERTGIVTCDLSALDTLARSGPVIIAPNHPSLIDAVLIVSRLPNVACIMKAKLWDHFIFGGAARIAGYIRNDSQARLVVDATHELAAGSHLLIFPEGTRTVDKDIQPFKGGYALIAKRAHAMVQAVWIEINHPFLSKGRPLLEKPEFPLVFRARLGERFMPPRDIRAFVSEMECYFRNETGKRFMEPPQ
ncbi:MAG: lysophospholipid acyltransferase family protein [Betaproteobacteria bacterium]|nr:lysophospholipid acyltransferase family protein [Betaproteobacteria bacterium]